MISCTFEELALHIISQSLNKHISPSEIGDVCQPQHFENFQIDDLKTILQKILQKDSFSKTYLLKYLIHTGQTCESFANVLRQYLDRTFYLNGSLIGFSSPDYPQHLRHIKSPPILLHAVGNVHLLTFPGYSVIGARKASSLALKDSFNLGRDLARLGFTVISGGAFGCDIATHQGVLASGTEPCPAIIVMAGGLAKMYPRHHENIFKKIIQAGGVVISEKLWDEPCRSFDFPVRNRIISGISPVTIVIQAGQRSGTLVTAKEALDQGREVIVAKPSSLTLGYEGSLALADDGAPTFENSNEIISFLESCG